MVDDRMPVVSFVGKSGSGKTTIIEQVIATLTSSGVRVGSIKHHGHPKFDIDVPGKDSWRFSQAGSVASVVVSKEKLGMVRQLSTEPGYEEIVAMMGPLDLVVIEGFRDADVPTIRVYRKDNPKQERNTLDCVPEKTIAVMTDMDEGRELAAREGIPAFGLTDVAGICAFIREHVMREDG